MTTVDKGREAFRNRKDPAKRREQSILEQQAEAVLDGEPGTRNDNADQSPRSRVGSRTRPAATISEGRAPFASQHPKKEDQ